MQIVESLKHLEPFGEENKVPLFVFKNLKIDSIRALSEGKHLKLTLKDNKNIVNAIGFNLGELANEYQYQRDKMAELDMQNAELKRRYKEAKAAEGIAFDIILNDANGDVADILFNL